ncbi:MAG: cupin domain-containing protein [Vampirovibrio sp.]|nr:cupin domain-containing protein [Vampirovibrio sp.]
MSSLSSSKPFEVIRWDAPKKPTAELLTRWLVADGLDVETVTFPVGEKTQELRYVAKQVRIVVSGHLQYAFPGYGVVELYPGDQLNIEANILYDVSNPDGVEAVLLKASDLSEI